MGTRQRMAPEPGLHAEGLDPYDVIAALDGDSLLIDVRPLPLRQGQGALPGDLHAPGPMLEVIADPVGTRHRPEFTPDRRIVVYCDTGHRSAVAAERLADRGYRRVAYLVGGLRQWRAHGLEVVPQDSPPSAQHMREDEA